MADQPTAHRLADTPFALRDGRWNCDADDELRRLHAENARLHQINWLHEVKLSVRGYEIQIEYLKATNAELTENLEKNLVAIQLIWKERDELRKRNAELLEALKKLEPILARMYGPQADNLPPMQIARAAIARAEGEKT